jgi:hypothetical protein
MRLSALVIAHLLLLPPLDGLAQTASPPSVLDQQPPPGTCPADPDEAKRLGCLNGGMLERAEDMKDAAQSMAAQGMAAGMTAMSRMLDAMQKSTARDEAASNAPKAVSPSPQKP